jgi:hypothetical protein
VTNITIDESRVNVEMDRGQKAKYGPYYMVYPEEFDNKAIYWGSSNAHLQNVSRSETIPSLHDSFMQASRGYHIVLFGYGYSGSGKTYTLFGNNTSPGIVQIGLDVLGEMCSISVTSVYEHKIVTDMKNPKILYNILDGQDLSSLHTIVDERTLDLNKTLEELNIKRKGETIKWTPNNPESSRSHLILTLTVQNKTNKTTGYITIIDMGGREDPMYIYDRFVKTKTFKFQNDNYRSLSEDLKAMTIKMTEVNKEKFQKTNAFDTDFVNNVSFKKRGDLIHDRLKYVYQIMREGFFINHTINMIVLYFHTKMARSVTEQSVAAYVQSNTNDEKVDATYNRNKFMHSKYKKDIMFKLMKALDGKQFDILSNIAKTEIENIKNQSDGKPTKFIMINVVNTEKDDRRYKHSESILSTLDYSQKINIVPSDLENEK